ncbi:MAG: YtxH domain-containing protein [Muribaculaceae bacterium]|nr:YtxH domain-containing protein [Muribaculaceae bacterium]
MSCCKAGAFLGGALIGAAAALLLAPESGEDLRHRIKKILKKYGVKAADAEEELDEIVEELAEEIISK